MKRRRAPFALGLVLGLAPLAVIRAADNITVSYPYLGITHITRVGSAPDFPRNVKIHVVKIDLTAPYLSFRYTPHTGTRDTTRTTTLQYMTDMGAQIAINGCFFLPFPSSDTDAACVGFAASNGDRYSPFELPTQNYAILKDSPAINIDPANHATIVHRDPAYSDGTCYGLCQSVNGTHALENVAIWNAFSGSAQIVTNGVKTIPCYQDAAHPDCELIKGTSVYSNGDSWYNRVNGRTSIGIGCDNKTLVLFTVDVINGSSGMTVGEVADLLIGDYGVCNALNMDGGGSVTLTMVDPATGIGSNVNSPSDNYPIGRANASGLAIYAAKDLQAPVTTAKVTPAPNASGWNNSNVVVDLNATDNPGGMVKQIEYYLTGAQPAGTRVVAGNTASFSITTEGVTTDHFFATDVAGNVESTELLPVKIDKTPPAISGMPGACTLWPPNHKLVEVATITAADALSGLAPGSLTVTAVSSGPNDPNDPSIVIAPNGSGGFVVRLMAERLGTGADKVYTLTATASDVAGNVARATASCTVPHDQGQ
jgi:hypothetical protein